MGTSYLYKYIMDTAFGEGWADAVSKILSIGKHNQAITILSKAKKDAAIEEQTEDRLHKPGKTSCRLVPQAQPDALVENELRSIATRGVVHLLSAVKAAHNALLIRQDSTLWACSSIFHSVIY